MIYCLTRTHTHTRVKVYELDYNAINETDTASPGYADGERDSHGTSCAGIIAMEKSNGVCGVGVAYNSNITGIIIIYQDYLF